jgi:hypothetical protein
MMRPAFPINTPEKVTQAREYLDMSKPGLARALRIENITGRNTIRRWETPGANIYGPVQIALEALIERADLTSDAAVDIVARAIMGDLDIDPDVYLAVHGSLNPWSDTARKAIASILAMSLFLGETRP